MEQTTEQLNSAVPLANRGLGMTTGVLQLSNYRSANSA
jgi:hypothetical protein